MSYTKKEGRKASRNPFSQGVRTWAMGKQKKTEVKLATLSPDCSIRGLFMNKVGYKADVSQKFYDKLTSLRIAPSEARELQKFLEQLRDGKAGEAFNQAKYSITNTRRGYPKLSVPQGTYKGVVQIGGFLLDFILDGNVVHIDGSRRGRLNKGIR